MSKSHDIEPREKLPTCIILKKIIGIDLDCDNKTGRLGN